MKQNSDFLWLLFNNFMIVKQNLVFIHYSSSTKYML